MERRGQRLRSAESAPSPRRVAPRPDGLQRPDEAERTLLRGLLGHLLLPDALLLELVAPSAARLVAVPLCLADAAPARRAREIAPHLPRPALDARETLRNGSRTFVPTLARNGPRGVAAAAVVVSAVVGVVELGVARIDRLGEGRIRLVARTGVRLRARVAAPVSGLLVPSLPSCEPNTASRRESESESERRLSVWHVRMWSERPSPVSASTDHAPHAGNAPSHLTRRTLPAGAQGTGTGSASG